VPEDLDCLESVLVLRDGREVPLEILTTTSGPHRVVYDDEDGQTVTFVLFAIINPLGWTRPDPVKSMARSWWLTCRPNWRCGCPGWGLWNRVS
jgi:hypothetical protein